MAKKSTNLKFYEAVGRRKSAIARVRLYISITDKDLKNMTNKPKKGDIIVNDRPAEEYFPGDVMKLTYMQPLTTVDAANRFVVSVITRGGGKHAQMEATLLGISRALEIAEAENRSLLKPKGFLSRDARVRERRKPGTGGRARRVKQSPKR